MEVSSIDCHLIFLIGILGSSKDVGMSLRIKSGKQSLQLIITSHELSGGSYNINAIPPVSMPCNKLLVASSLSGIIRGYSQSSSQASPDVGFLQEPDVLLSNV